MRRIAATTCTTCRVRARRPGQRTCNSCHAAQMRRHRPKHSDLPDDARRRANARAYANVYLSRGKIARQPCEVCGSPDVQMHHDDYSQPLVVRWLCALHHLDVTHRRVRHDGDDAQHC